MEHLFSIQTLVHYYDKSSVDHAAVRRLLVSAKIDALQLLLSDGSTTTLDTYVLIPRADRPPVVDVLADDAEPAATVASVVMLAEARAAADSIASSAFELDDACSALERLLASLNACAEPTGPLGLGSELSIDACTYNRVYCHGLVRRYRAFAQRPVTAPPPPAAETPGAILTAVNARLRLCDLATHCLAVVARRCVTNEEKCREAVVLSTRLLALAASLPVPARDASASFSSRNSLRTALISGAIHLGVIVSENFGIDINPWVGNANRLMLNSFTTGSGQTQVIAAIFGGMIPSCSEYRSVHTAKTAARVMMPLRILHTVLGELLDRTNSSIEAKKHPAPSESVSRPEAASGDKGKISKAAQSFLGERVVAAEEDGDEGRISGSSAYNACENYIKRAREGSGIRGLLCNLLESAVSHYSSVQSQLPSSRTHVTNISGEDADVLTDGSGSNSDGQPGSIDFIEGRARVHATFRSRLCSDSEHELCRTLSLHRDVAVLCIEVLSTWLTLDSLSAGRVDIDAMYSLLEVVCLHASTLLVSKSVSMFEVREALSNYGMVCGSILSQRENSEAEADQSWEDAVQSVSKKCRRCVALMKPLLSFADPLCRAKGVFSCYVSDYLSFSQSSNAEETKQVPPDEYLLYMMSLISSENSLDLLRVFSDLLLKSSALQGGTPTLSIVLNFAISVHILNYLVKLSYGLQPTKSNVQISIVRLCHRKLEGGQPKKKEETTVENDLSSSDVATLKPSQQVQSSFQSVLKIVEELLLRMNSQVLNPMRSAARLDGRKGADGKPSNSRGSSQPDLTDASEALLDSSVRLRKTIDTLLGTSFMQDACNNQVCDDRSYLSEQRTTENAVDAQLVLLGESGDHTANDEQRSVIATALVRLFCDSSPSVRLFSSRRFVYILQQSVRLPDGSFPVSEASEVDSMRCSSFGDVSQLKSPSSSGKDSKAAEAPKWAYSCDNCTNVCEKEWWHCMDCEDFDLCSKCIRLPRSSLSSPHPDTHVFIRGTPDHNLDEFNNAKVSGGSNGDEDLLFRRAYDIVMVELAGMKNDDTTTSSGYVFLDAAQMISTLISRQTRYPIRLQYMERLCVSKVVVDRVIQCSSEMVSQIEKDPVCDSEFASCARDWDFAYQFLQVFANVRDALLLPCLFKSGIPDSFARILQNLEPMLLETFHLVTSGSSSTRAKDDNKSGMFEKSWSQRPSAKVLLPEPGSGTATGPDIVSLNSPIFQGCTLGSSVTACVQLAVRIIDFFIFALQCTKGPDVEVVREHIPKRLLCVLASSENKERRLKSSPEAQKLVRLAKMLLLIVNEADESKMNRVIDTHIFHTRVSELEDSVQGFDGAHSTSKYNFQVEIATVVKALYRLVCRRPGTWRAFAAENPGSLEIIYKASLICDRQTESSAMQLLATGCCVSKEMAVDSMRGRKPSSSSGNARFDCPPPKMKKKPYAHRRDPPKVRPPLPKPSIPSEDDVKPSNTRSEWVDKCVQSCKQEKQVDVKFFCSNDFEVLKRIVFTLLLQRQNEAIRASCSRILCCLIARAAVSETEELAREIFSVLIVALNRMPTAGALGAELGQSLEVFLSFCFEDYFKCLGMNRVSRIASILVDSLRARAACLVSHPNGHIYKGLSSVVDIQGYYLEDEPCATCSTSAFESMVPTTQRLDAIRVESKFSDCSISCRLVSVQAVSGVSVSVVDPSRTRRVEKIDVFYSPRIVSDAAELQNPDHPWRHFAALTLTRSQLESKVELAVPLAAANLRFVFWEFRGSDDASCGSVTGRDAGELSSFNNDEDTSPRGVPNAQNLQCPRCSRSVTDPYGVCGNCRENAFQCRQCRNINYENLDGLLCNECGHCKHGRFEFSVLCNSSFVSEKVVCEEDRKRATLVIEKETAEVHRRHGQLEKMRARVVQALSLGPKGFAEVEVSKEDYDNRGKIIADHMTSRADIAALEALLGIGSHTSNENIDYIQPMKPGSGLVEKCNVFNALDFSEGQDRDVVVSGTHPFSFLTSRGSTSSHSVSISTASSTLSRHSNLLSVLYNKECKALFLAMSQSIRVLSAARSELMDYVGNGSKELKSAPVNDSESCVTSSSNSHPNQCISGNVHSSPCYGCSQSFLSICVDLLQSIARFGSDAALGIKNAELALELLRLSFLCEKRDVQMHIRRLIVHIVSDNETASDIICREVSRKIEFCIDSFASIDARSTAQVELAVLEDIALIEDDLWEKRFKAVIRLLFRASKTSLLCASVSESIMLPCLRIALHMLKADENPSPIPLDDLPVTTCNGKEAPQPSAGQSSDPVDNATSNSSVSGAVPELEVSSVDLGTAEAVAGSTGNISHQGDGSESLESSERLNAVDQLSGSGALSSVGTTFELQGSDDDSQRKPADRSALNVNEIMAFLREAHISQENTVNVERWLCDSQNHEEWLSVLSTLPISSESIENEEQYRLRRTKTCFQKWRAISHNETDISWAVRLILLAPCAGVRQLASSLLERLVSSEELLVIRLLNMLTGSSLDTAVSFGDRSREFFDLFIKLISPRANRLHLIVRSLPVRLAKMIFTEAERLLEVENNLNGAHAFSLSHGFVLHRLVAVLKLLLQAVSKTRASVRAKIFKTENATVVKYLQQAYLFIQGLLSLRTRLTDECGTILCEILSSKEYLFFAPTSTIVVRSCVSELKRAHERDDVQTVAVLSKQLCGMLCPETTEPVCYLTLDKAPTQDEFIRGRMSKNPYSSKTFSGPLMRDVKNKICQDLSLPGLLEDDFAMELLVAGNIIKLDLPVMDVYEQVWRGSPAAAMAASSPGAQRNFGSRGSSNSGISSGSITHAMERFPPARCPSGPMRSFGETEERNDPPMAVIYRLSGLDGAATEPHIESLEDDCEDEQDLEKRYKSTEALGDVGGLEVLLSLLSDMGSWGDDAKTAVREPTLKLLRACCEVSKNRSILAATPGTLKTLLGCAASAFEHARHSSVAVESAESLLMASERILAVQSSEQTMELETPIQANISEVLSALQVFLGRLTMLCSTKAAASILHLLPFLIQGIPAAVQTAIDYFSFDWKAIEVSDKDDRMAGRFATFLIAAPRDYRGQAIVLRALEQQVAVGAVKYLLEEFPMPKAENKETWNNSLEHDGPPHALKLLTGMAYGCATKSIRRSNICQHIEAAIGLSESVIPMLCQLEMVASSSAIGSIAEELLGALKEIDSVSDCVDTERRNLKAARRAAALASRQAILQETGLSASEPQEAVEEKSSEFFSSEMFDDVLEETGPACVVCGDGFKSRPHEALGVYVLNCRVSTDCSIKAVLSSFKTSPNPMSRREVEIASGRSRRKSSSSSNAFCFSTVSQFNAIHISCHREATRSDRSARRQEWEGAALRNSQTVCNNILPILPPLICDTKSTKEDSSPTTALNSMSAAVDFYFSRMSSLGQSGTCSHRLVLYDLGRCLIRFADGGAQVFSEHSKGGGPHSNACLIPHLVQLSMFTLEESPAVPAKAKDDIRSNVNVLAVQSDIQKFVKNERGGDYAYHLAAAVVLLSASEWCDVLPAYLRLALKEVDEAETALRLVAFADACVLFLKCAAGKKDWICSLREHIGHDEAFSVSFADAVTELWEGRVRNLKSKEEFWEAINETSRCFEEKCGESGRGPEFEEKVREVTDKL